MAKHWTPAEDAVLKAVYQHSSKAEIMPKFPNKDWLAIRLRAQRLKLHRDKALIDKDRTTRGPRKDAWQPEEEALLREIYPIKSKQEILDAIGRPWAGIWSRAYHLGLIRNSDMVKQEMIEGGSKAPAREDFWSAEEDAYLKENYKHGDKKEILTRLKERTWKAIREHALYIGLSRRDRALINVGIVASGKTTLRERYGVQGALQVPGAMDKFRQTSRANRGTDYPLQSPEVREKVKQTNRKHYGVDNVFQSPEIKRLIREKQKELGVGISQEEIEFLKFLRMIDSSTQHQVDHPIGFTIDYYMPKYDLWVQYDGIYWHGFVKNSKQFDRIRKNDNRQNRLIPNLIRFRSDEVKRNRKEILRLILDKINIQKLLD